MATIDANGILHDYQGNTWDWEFQFYEDANGTIEQDISNWLLIFGLKANASDSDDDALIIVTHQAGSGPNDDPANGKAFLRVESDITKPVAVNNVANPYTYVIKRVIPRDPEPPLVETLELGKMIVESQALQKDSV